MKTTARKTPAKPAAKTAAPITITLPALKKDEHNAGIIFTDGKPSHHVILLPGELKPSPWAKAGAWAKKQGGELPTRREQSLLFANAKEQFQGAWYWSCEPYASDASFAWMQYFRTGLQYCFRVGHARARAVRRVAI